VKICLGRQYRFFASHRLNSPFLSEEENRKIYGKCNYPKGHGHTYKVTILVTGEVNPKTGMILPMEELDRVVEKVLKTLQYRFLETIPYFEKLPSTGERISKYLWENLKPLLPPGILLSEVLVEETKNNRFAIRERER
jgi:6-pyruvoyltetrahydropterin/6-carboxytetrahydropterin synthase